MAASASKSLEELCSLETLWVLGDAVLRKKTDSKEMVVYMAASAGSVAGVDSRAELAGFDAAVAEVVLAAHSIEVHVQVGHR